MSKPALSGIIPAIPTPLLDNEDIDIESLKKLVDYVIERGAKGIFVLGNMGEGAALLDSQKLAAVETAVKHANGRIPVLAGIAEVSVRRMIELGRKIKDLAPDYLVMTTPFYYRFPHPDSLYNAAAKVCAELDYPMVMYHCPKSTGNHIDLDTMLKIMRIPHMKALKDSSGDINMFMELLRQFPDKTKRSWVILQGMESMYDISLPMGADGVITGGGTALLDTLVKLYQAASVENNRLKAFTLQQQFQKELNSLLGPEPATNWMHAVKARLKKSGIINDNVVCPFMKKDSE